MIQTIDLLSSARCVVERDGVVDMTQCSTMQAGGRIAAGCASSASPTLRDRRVGAVIDAETNAGIHASTAHRPLACVPMRPDPDAQPPAAMTAATQKTRRSTALIAALAFFMGTGATALAADAPDCKARLLQSLGWRFVATNAPQVSIEAGTPCDRANLAQARAAGDLVVRVPQGLDAAARARLDDELLRHPATHCAYGYALGDAARRAADKLAGNPGYRFSALQLGWVGFGPTGSRRDGWEPVASFGRGYRPRGSNSRAIEAFYHGHVRSECGVGRQVAQYATQAELYGAEGFDAGFDADEIVIGTFNRLHDTRSILLGSSAGEFTGDGLAVAASRAGRQAFMGLPGFIFHVFGRNKLDDLNNQAENFVVYDVDADAADALREHGGFEHYNERNKAIWTLAKSMPVYRPKRYFERLLFERDAALRANLPPAAQATLAQLDTELADPFYRGFRIYVHRQGVKPLGFHIARLLDRNPRTPFRIELALHNLHTTLFARYVSYRLRECSSADANPNPKL